MEKILEEPVENSESATHKRLEKRIPRMQYKDGKDCFTFFLPEDPNELAQGFIDYKIYQDSLQVYSIFVARKSRVQGIGKKLVDEVIKIAKEKGKGEILVVGGGNQDSVFGRFLRSLGFQHIDSDMILRI